MKLLMAGLMGLALVAQQKAAEPAATAAPLTALEQLQLDHLGLREAYARLAVQFDACVVEKGEQARELGNFRAQLASRELTEDEAALKAAIEKARPGFLFDPKTRAFTPAPTPDKGK